MQENQYFYNVFQTDITNKEITQWLVGGDDEDNKIKTEIRRLRRAFLN